MASDGARLNRQAAFSCAHFRNQSCQNRDFGIRFCRRALGRVSEMGLLLLPMRLWRENFPVAGHKPDTFMIRLHRLVWTDQPLDLEMATCRLIHARLDYATR